MNILRLKLVGFGFVFIFISQVTEAGIPCASRSYGLDSIVCVCNITYCDTLDPITQPPLGSALVYESNKAGLRFQKKQLNFTPSPYLFHNSLREHLNRVEWEASSYRSPLSSNVLVSVNRVQTYQKILGFGGAFTDAAGINILSLPSVMQTQVIQGYYSSNGSEYSIGRVPMASCDFSTHNYSYDGVAGDLGLEHFNLTEEDFCFKIPLLKAAQRMSSQKIKLIASPWSSPAWMKTNGQMSGRGTLKGQPGGQYYQAWADYFVKFLQAYEQKNITFWGVTAENEPMNGIIEDFSFQCLGFTPETQRDFIKLNLGPTLEEAGYGPDRLKLIIMDDQRLLLPKWAKVVLGDPHAAQYVAGIAFHWYLNFIAPPKLLDITHETFPEKFILSTEACVGSMPWELEHVALGSWLRGESYAHDIIEDLLHWTVGWVDWNLALDTSGGPNWVGNFVDAPVIVNTTAKEFYRQPMYYILAHFSKFIPPGSVRIGLNVKQLSDLEIVAFKTPVNATVVIVFNRGTEAITLTLHDQQLGYLSNTVSPNSIQSYVWSSH